MDYSGVPAAGNLISSVAPAAGVDPFGNNYLQGVASYQSAFANAMIGGALLFYTGSLAGGWTFQGQLLISGGSLLADFTDFEVDGTMEVSGNVTLDSGLTVEGNASIEGGTIEVGSGSLTENNFNMASPMGTPPNYPLSGASTVAQIAAFCNSIVTELNNRGMMNT